MIGAGYVDTWIRGIRIYPHSDGPWRARIGGPQGTCSSPGMSETLPHPAGTSREAQIGGQARHGSCGLLGAVVQTCKSSAESQSAVRRIGAHELLPELSGLLTPTLEK